MHLRALALALALSTLVGAAHAQGPDLVLEALPDGQNEPLNVVVTENSLNQTGPVWWRDSFNKLGTDYMRLHIRVLQTDPNSDAVVTIEGLGDKRYSYK